MNWTVYKFGGASVKDAAAIRNLVNIVANSKIARLIVVVSAMGKTTNSLEELWQHWINNQDQLAAKKLVEIEMMHKQIVLDLFDGAQETFELDEVSDLMADLKKVISQPAPSNIDEAYDAITPFGELLSTTIIHRYMVARKMYGTWLDARKLIITDDTYREAKIDWIATRGKVLGALANLPSGFNNLVVTQGFIGGFEDRQTTLGREGSDYSAAILAHCVDANSMTIWKDVSGVLNADPKYFDDTELLENISFKEAIELSYYGATVIHPKTIKPLQNLSIPLLVKSFLNPDSPGTTINEATSNDDKIPSYIFKVNQRLISIQPRDFSFIVEENLVDIFGLFAKARVKIHLMENSALSFTVCADESARLEGLIITLKHNYLVRYNEGLELVTVRHCNQTVIDKLLAKKTVLLEQKSRETARFVVR
jgi:aspartate kinase